jgi:hypothetical protein
MAEADEELATRQPWKAAVERDYGWLGRLMDEHYAGDDRNVMVLAAGILAAYDGISVEDFEAQAGAFLRSMRHPTLGRGYVECAYAPMLDLLAYLDANEFSSYIVSGGGRDFMRPISQEVYGIPRQRVIGSSAALAYAADPNGGTITHKAEASRRSNARRARTGPWSASSTTGRRSSEPPPGAVSLSKRSGRTPARGEHDSRRRETLAACGLRCSTSREAGRPSWRSPPRITRAAWPIPSSTTRSPMSASIPSTWRGSLPTGAR